MSSKKLGFATVVLWFVGACATPTGPGFEDVGGEGGEGGEGGMSNGNGGASMSSSSSSSGSASSGASSSSSSSASSASSSSGGPMCGATEHLCSGVCAPNTPQTGCFTSQTCSPCLAPANGSSICSAQGLCDVSCNSGYNKSGTTCVCASACCQNADCPSGQTCMGGTCSGGGGGTCDQAVCIATCLIQGKLGICQGSTCLCI